MRLAMNKNTIANGLSYSALSAEPVGFFALVRLASYCFPLPRLSLNVLAASLGSAI